MTRPGLQGGARRRRRDSVSNSNAHGQGADGRAAYERGNELAAAGCLDEAETAYRRALVEMPDFAEAHNNLGNVLLRVDRCAEAVEAYRAAFLHGLVHPLVFYNLGTALRRTGDVAGAERHFAAAVAMRPDYAEAWNNLGNLWRENALAGPASRVYLRALRLRPDWEDAHDNLSGALYLLHERGDGAEAVSFAATWLSAHPDHPQARHLGAALAGAIGDQRASDAYVRQVFDNFADGFDAQLETLRYRAPALLIGMLADYAAHGARGALHGLDVLDAGCGTGLCGPGLRRMASRLDGVDLSGGMLARARARGGYDNLFEAELTTFLGDHPKGYDLIVAADVFCYFGDLSSAFSAALSSLREGGLFAFSVERLEGAGEEKWRLLPHGRYAHRREALLTALAAAGLSIITLREDTLREESGAAVAGLLVLAGR